MLIHNNVEEFAARQPSSYRFLKQISFRREIGAEGCSRYEVEIVLSRILDNKVDDMTILCSGASNIRMGDIDGMFGMLLDIEDIGSHQLEGVSYRVTEQENNAFSLLCREFQVDLPN